MRRLSSVWLAGIAALALVACSGDSEREPDARSVSQAIVNGTASVKEQDFVVQISIKKNDKMIPHCTGTLIAKNIVITARHCVGDVSDTDATIKDFAPSKLAIYTGTSAGRKTVDQEPEAHGAQLFVKADKTLTPDIALILLDVELDAPIAPIRLESGAVRGESLDIIGYGLTETDEYPSVRQQRNNVPIVKTGPGKTTLFELAAGEFQFGEAACAGDSGGPAIAAETGALVGIASRVSNGTERSTLTPSSFCIGEETEDIYTDLTPAKAIIEAAFEAAGATPWLEGEPSPAEKAAAAAAEQQAAEAAAKKDAEDKAAAAEGCSMHAHAPSSLPANLAFLALGAALILRSRRR